MTLVDLSEKGVPKHGVAGTLGKVRDIYEESDSAQTKPWGVYVLNGPLKEFYQSWEYAFAATRAVTSDRVAYWR